MTFFSVGINSCQHWRVFEDLPSVIYVALARFEQQRRVGRALGLGNPLQMIDGLRSGRTAPPSCTGPPVDGRTASDNPLNGAQSRILTAQSWMGGRSAARNDVLTPSVCGGRGYTSLRP
jgi:hypothetical protein